MTLGEASRLCPENAVAVDVSGGDMDLTARVEFKKQGFARRIYNNDPLNAAAVTLKYLDSQGVTGATITWNIPAFGFKDGCWAKVIQSGTTGTNLFAEM